MKTCYIIGAAPLYNFQLNKKENDIVFAADAGLKHLEKLGIKPDVVVGDFDSYGSIPSAKELIKLNPIKDDTDTMICIKKALEMGYEKIVIFGGMGGKFEHSLANLQALAYIKKHGAHGFLIGEREAATVIEDETAFFSEDASGFVSLFSLDSSIIATETGLKYSLDEDTVTNDFPIGVSNEFLNKPAKITVKGKAVVIYEIKNGIDAVKFL